MELFQWLKLYLFISLLFKTIPKCHTNLILLSLSIFCLETSLKLVSLLCQSIWWHFSEAILKDRYFPHLREANLISRRSVKIYLYCSDSQMCWTSLTRLMPIVSTRDNEAIYGNRYIMKIMHTPRLPQYYAKLLIYVHLFRW